MRPVLSSVVLFEFLGIYHVAPDSGIDNRRKGRAHFHTLHLFSLAGFSCPQRLPTAGIVARARRGCVDVWWLVGGGLGVRMNGPMVRVPSVTQERPGWLDPGLSIHDRGRVVWMGGWWAGGWGGICSIGHHAKI